MKDSDRFFVTWLPLWKCNFKCPYCTAWFSTNALEFQPLNTLIKAWDNLFSKIYNTKNEINLVITGGEPTIYPNFFELLKYFTSKVSEVHVATNLSFNVQDFLNFKISKDILSFNTTFHPSCISLDKFLDNLILMKDYIKENVQFVATEDNLKNQEEIVKRINDCGIKAYPFFLKYVGQNLIEESNSHKKTYDVMEVLNSKEETTLIKKIRSDQNLPSSAYENAEISSFGKKCMAGYKYIHIFPNGNIRQCSVDKGYLGNLFDNDLNLYKEPQTCKQKTCSHQNHAILE